LATNRDFQAVTKAIQPERDRLQSKLLTTAVCAALIFVVFRIISVKTQPYPPDSAITLSALISLIFGGIVWSLRAATRGGVASGTLICFCLLTGSGKQTEHHSRPHWTTLAALVALFVISFTATRFRRAQKEDKGLAEARHGRKASQIIANLGAAAVFATAGSYIACIAALAEAAADTASSEIGQTLGGRVRLLTTLKAVPTGTDGGITVKGTLAGVLSALIVVIIGFAGVFELRAASVALLAACAGLIFDSLLGATVEQRGWLGNDLVNFSSTVFAGLLAALLY